MKEGFFFFPIWLGWSLVFFLSFFWFGGSERGSGSLFLAYSISEAACTMVDGYVYNHLLLRKRDRKKTCMNGWMDCFLLDDALC